MAITLRHIKESDLDDLNELNEQQDFRISSLRNKVVDRVVVEDGRVIGYGIVKVLAEAILLIDLKEELITRAKAMRALMRIAFLGCKQEGIEQLHVFVKDEKLARSLEKHFGFKRTSDIVLVKNLGE